MERQKQSFWLVIIACLVTALTAFSDDQSNATPQSPTKSGNGFLYSLKYGTNRKRAPSNNFLKLYYEDGLLTLESSINEGEFSIQLTNEKTDVIEYVQSVTVGETVVIDLDYGVYSIMAFSVDGNEYGGELIITSM